MKCLKNNAHFVSFDNFFSSYNFFEALSELKLRAIGTIRLDRFQKPPFMSEADMKEIGRGSCFEVTRKDDKVSLVRWFVNKLVHVGSNRVCTGSLTEAKRWNIRSKTHDLVQVP